MLSPNPTHCFPPHTSSNPQGSAWDGLYKVVLQDDGFGLVSDNFMFPFVLKAFSRLAAWEKRKEVYGEARRKGIGGTSDRCDLI
ncbi:hypothetical protein AKJ16_DCAP15159 [Drosera capensis]